MLDHKATTAQIYQTLHQRLLTGGFAPGQRLKSQSLRKDFGCSANTIREVLLRLATVGLVTSEEQRGFRVRDASDELCHDVTRFRILLEQEAAAMSMQNGGLEWEAKLSAAHHKLSHIESRIAKTGTLTDDMVLWSTAEWEFHETLTSACGSPLLRQTYSNVYNQFRQQMVWRTRDFNSGYFHGIVLEHQLIVDAALSRDAVLCRQVIYDHLKRNL